MQDLELGSNMMKKFKDLYTMILYIMSQFRL